MKVLFLTNVPSPYRVDFFNKLGELCDLTVIFEKSTSDERDCTWENYDFRSFKGVILSGISTSVDSSLSPRAIPYLRNRAFDQIVCTTFLKPTGMLAIEYMRMHHIPYSLECDGGFAKDGAGLKEKIKHHFIKGARAYFSTGSSTDEYYTTYGADPKRIYRYPFSSVLNKDILPRPVNADEKGIIRKRLGISEEKVILAVGQFIPRKGFDVLIRAARGLTGDVGIYFVGGVPTDEYLRMCDEFGLSNIHFVGYKEKPQLSEYYKAADLFVLPTREDIWGLVIEEAMAQGLPVISTDRCGAALELVCDGENGFVVPVENETALAQCIMKVLENDDLRHAMCENNLRDIRAYTIETMAERHIELFREVSEN